MTRPKQHAKSDQRDKAVAEGWKSKHNAAPRRLLPTSSGNHGRPRRRLKDIVNALACQTTALQVFPRSDRIAHILAHPLRAEPPPATPPHLLLRNRIIPQILLQRNEDDGDFWAALSRLLGPLVLDVGEGVGRVDGETNEDHVGFGVGEGSEALVVFLAGGVPEGELDGFAVDAAVCYVVLEDSGYVSLQRLRVSRA